jgi:uncharacterized protein (TIGR03790 family)
MPLRVAVFLAALALLPTPAAGQSADNLLVVANTRNPQSVQIAEHYVQVRRVPEHHVVRIDTTDAEHITRAAYQSTIEGPIAAWLARHRLQDQVLYIVLTKGVPLRIDGTGGLSGTVASVDSELTLLYRKLVGTPASVVGRLDNPYFLGDKPISQAQQFSRLASDLYLVTRLDGFTVEDVIALIDRGASPVRDGQVVLDQRATMVDRGGDAWLAQAAERLTGMSAGPRVVLESTRSVAKVTGPVLGYYSWGSNDPANQERQMGMAFVSGSIGGMFVSTDGRTFREPGTGWRPAPAGSTTGGQSLAGDLIREGITGVSAHVTEPLLDAIIRPQVLFPAYLSGFTLAESYYLAMPFLSWQDIVIGDPLCAPFLQVPLTPPQIHRGLDPETDLPALFAERSLAALKSLALNTDALKLVLKAGSLQAQGRPLAEVHALLAKATTIEPRLTAAQIQLAQAAEVAGNVDEAIVRYRAVLSHDRDHVVALNNLAYLLADRKGEAAEALPLAERAYRLAGQSAAVADTLGWIHYRLGNPAAALPYLDRAARLESTNADILLHAATAHASLNSLAQARIYFDAALKLDPKAIERDDVKALRERIKK